MPSIDDLFQELHDLNTNTLLVRDELTHVNETLNSGFSNVLSTMQTMVVLDTYAAQALSHLSKQDDTIICILEKISQSICNLLNESHTQTGLQASLEKSSNKLLELYRDTHPNAALALARVEDLRKQLEDCCPPELPEPVCTYEPCQSPPPLERPPVEREPIG